MSTIPHHPAYPTNTAGICDPTAKESGLTKRELFAAMAMQGLCANSYDNIACVGYERVAIWAAKHADALIAELSK